MDKNAAIVVMTDEERLEFIFEAAFSFGLDGKRSLIISQPLQTLDGIDNEKYKLKPAVLEMIQIRFARDIREITEYCHNILFRRPHLPDSIFLNGLETFLDASDPNFFLDAYNLCCVVLDAWKSCSRLRVQPKSSHNQDCGVGRLVVAINTKTLESQPAFSQLFTSIVSKADAIKLFELPP